MTDETKLPQPSNEKLAEAISRHFVPDIQNQTKKQIAERLIAKGIPIPEFLKKELEGGNQHETT